MKRQNINRHKFQKYASKAIDFLMMPYCKPDVLISGFYRSGTTWVQEVVADVLHAKTNFEPLGPQNRPPFLKGKNITTSQAFFPTRFDDFTKQDLRFLDRAFKGFTLYGFSYTARYHIAESIRKNVVTKLVRGHFILPELTQRYNIKAIHIRRHPCAVINSFHYTKWTWGFQDIVFSKLYPDMTALHAYDNAQPFEKIAAFWAFTENQIHESDNIHILHYENLVMQDMKPLFALIGKTSPKINIDSAVSSSGREDLQKQDRLYSWKKTLPEDQQKRTLEIVASIAPDLAKHF